MKSELFGISIQKCTKKESEKKRRGPPHTLVVGGETIIGPGAKRGALRKFAQSFRN